jgi:aspartyl-tRNA synthetase
VTLLHRLEHEGWVKRASAVHDRRCKLVLLGRRAQSVIAQINAAADELRQELLADIAASELETCIKVLGRIRARAEKHDKSRSNGVGRQMSSCDGQNGNGQRITNQREHRRGAAKRK